MVPPPLSPAFIFRHSWIQMSDLQWSLCRLAPSFLPSPPRSLTLGLYSFQAIIIVYYNHLFMHSPRGPDCKLLEMKPHLVHFFFLRTCLSALYSNFIMFYFSYGSHLSSPEWIIIRFSQSITKINPHLCYHRQMLVLAGEPIKREVVCVLFFESS